MGEMKRIAAPKFWKISRKSGGKYVMCPSPGPHKKEECLPIGIILRDYMGISENSKESKRILSKGLVKINGKVRKDPRFPVGLMDILEIGEQCYRMVPGKEGIYPKTIRDFDTRLCKVMNKKYVKGGRVQINLSGGENIIVKKEEDDFKTGDVIALDIKKGEIKKVVRMAIGALALITGGRNTGKIGTVEAIEVVKNPLPTLITIKLVDKSVKVPKDYVFVIGEKEPLVEV